MKCPKCGRDTYSKKWGSCTACNPPGQAFTSPAGATVTKSVTEGAKVTPRVSPTSEEVTQTITEERPVLVPVTESVTPGESCPTCGQKVPMTNAQRQAAYRDRKEVS
jgi:hypothetical protein